MWGRGDNEGSFRTAALIPVRSKVFREVVSLSFPSMSSSVPVGLLVGWMVLLTVKHIIADFVLQNAWIAHGKDQKTGWALPLLVH